MAAAVSAKKLGFDPRKKFNRELPVTIDNPYPIKLWPFAPNTEVVAIYRGTLIKGVVRWYNPALTESMVITKGQPLFTLQVEGGGSRTVGAEDVAIDCHGGRAHLYRKLAQVADAEVQRLRTQALEMVKVRDSHKDRAYREERRIRGMGPLPKTVAVIEQSASGWRIYRDTKTGKKSEMLYGSYELRLWLKSIGYRVQFGD